MNAVAEQVNLPVSVPATPMDMLAAAVSQGADIDKLQKLMELQERWEANNARRKFVEAFAAFKAEAIVIIKRTEIKDGPLKGKKHANLFDVVDAVTPKLSAHGLTMAWKLTKDEKDWMEVTCTLRHVAGHSETVSMGSGPDAGPGRNAIQARASAKSYLERYTATAILGLAASDADDDGKAAGAPDPKPVESPEGYGNWKADMTALADEGSARLQDAWKKSDKEMRRFVVTHDNSWWTTTKNKAQKVLP